MIKYLKIVIDWKEIAKTISKLWGKPISPSYCRTVYQGVHINHKMNAEINRIIDKGFSKPVTVSTDLLKKDI
jgi:hypothetical protein